MPLRLKHFFWKTNNCTSINNRTYVLTRIRELKNNFEKTFDRFTKQNKKLFFFNSNKKEKLLYNMKTASVLQKKTFLLRSYQKNSRRNFVILKLGDLCIEMEIQRQSHIFSHVNNNTPLGQNLISKRKFFEKKKKENGMHNCAPLPPVRKAIGFLKYSERIIRSQKKKKNLSVLTLTILWGDHIHYNYEQERERGERGCCECD